MERKVSKRDNSIVAAVIKRDARDRSERFSDVGW